MSLLAIGVIVLIGVALVVGLYYLYAKPSTSSPYHSSAEPGDEQVVYAKPQQTVAPFDVVAKPYEMPSLAEPITTIGEAINTPIKMFSGPSIFGF